MSELESQVRGLAGREDSLRDWIFERLHRRFSSETEITKENSGEQFPLILFERGFVLQKEASLQYTVEGTASATLSHRSDLLLCVFNRKMQLCPVLNVEIKYRSCVSDVQSAGVRPNTSKALLSAFDRPSSSLSRKREAYPSDEPG
jgi:hypothetical protein